MKLIVGDGPAGAFFAGYVATAAVLARKRMPFLMFAAACVLGGKAAQMASQVTRDLHALAAEVAEVANDRAWAAEIARDE
jgi:hypothetical protein